MIVTVTMNPAIDKTIEIERLEHGGLNRIRSTESDVGGKGINVSKTILELGGSSIATGFLGGTAGMRVETFLKEQGITTDFVYVEGETRTNTKVWEQNGELTELNETGPQISETHMKELLEKLKGYAGEGTLFVLAGSVPCGVEKDIYEKIVAMVHEKGASILVDADGDLFRHAVEAGPDMIKPNRVELERYMNMDYRACEQELIHIGRQMLKKGIQKVAISLGKSGAIFLEPGYEVKCPALKVKAHSTVGAGDAMVAALAYAWEKKLNQTETVKLCMAASAGAVTTIGTKAPGRTFVDALMEQVEINQIEGER